jgi:hypothetical protein
MPAFIVNTIGAIQSIVETESVSEDRDNSKGEQEDSSNNQGKIEVNPKEG